MDGLSLSETVTHPDGTIETLSGEELGEIAIVQKAFTGNHKAMRLVLKWIMQSEIEREKLDPPKPAVTASRPVNEAPLPNRALEILNIAGPHDRTGSGLGVRTWALDHALARRRTPLENFHNWWIKDVKIPDVDPSPDDAS